MALSDGVCIIYLHSTARFPICVPNTGRRRVIEEGSSSVTKLWNALTRLRWEACAFEWTILPTRPDPNLKK